MGEVTTVDVPEDVAADVEMVLTKACERGLRLATAESCTGGLLASILTDVEGRSHAFERGFVVYTDGAKRDLLGVPEAVLESDGAVSKRAALAMAEGAIERSDADIAVSVTGYAGPGSDGCEEGLVHFACARRGGPTFHRERHFGPIGRTGVRMECLRAALRMIDEIMP